MRLKDSASRYSMTGVFSLPIACVMSRKLLFTFIIVRRLCADRPAADDDDQKKREAIGRI